MTEPRNSFGRVALITTEDYITRHRLLENGELAAEVQALAEHFQVLTTSSVVSALGLNAPVPDDKNCDQPFATQHDHLLRIPGSRGITTIDSALGGILATGFHLVEGRIDAIAYLAEPSQSTLPEGWLLCHAAKAHNVPLARNVATLRGMAKFWLRHAMLQDSPFPPRIPREARSLTTPLRGIEAGDRGIALMAHDTKMLDLCRLIVERRDYIMKMYQFILAMGSTGRWVGRLPKRDRTAQCGRALGIGPVGA
jgi:methylglyoxal synthase